MQALLDFNGPLNIPLLDQVTNTMLTGRGAEQAEAQSILAQFQDNPNVWVAVPDILQQSSNPQTKYIALQILEKVVKTKWKVLPADQRDNIRSFIINTVITVSAEQDPVQRDKAYLNKLNLILVGVLKHEWPDNWPDFIPQLINSSQNNLGIVENNMVILRLLSEEVFEFSADQLTTSKTRAMKARICQEFSEVFQLCVSILTGADSVPLLKATLEAMLRFLTWIPLGYIFETSIIDTLINRYLPAPVFRNLTLKCLSEIAGLNVGPEYNSKFIILCNLVMPAINKMLPLNINIAEVYPNSSESDQQLVQNIAIFLVNFLSAHNKLLETPELQDMLQNAHHYLVKISEVDEREIFKICLEYWNKLVADLYEEMNRLPGEMGGMGSSVLSLGFGSFGTSGAQQGRRGMYAPILSMLRLVMVEHMAKPEEVLIVENEDGEIVREFLKEIDTIVLYKSMREVLVYLTHLDVVDTEMIMTEKLAKQVDGSEWSWGNLNTLCWAIGSISGAMTEETEKRFLVTVIKDLLGLTEMKRGKDNKAVVASNIMYIVGQYPRFLKAHWKFLKTVVNKLFEFAHETHEGVQDMACDTFIKIAQKCRRHFVMQQQGETEPFIDEILRTLPKITSDLSTAQVHTFYEALGYMISSQPNKPQQELLIAKLMEAPNNAWDGVVARASANPQVLTEPETTKILLNILKTNISACTSIGTFFMPQIARIFPDMMGLYGAISVLVNTAIQTQGPIATKTPTIRHLRAIKKDILRLVGETFIKRSEDLDYVGNHIVPSLLETILPDFAQSIPDARDAEVLSCVSTIVGRLGPLMNDKILPIFESVFVVTLSMIDKDFTEFPEHRLAFYKLLRVINLHCFNALVVLPNAQFRMITNALVWGMRHTSRDIADLTLNTLVEIVENVLQAGPDVANGFFQQYFVELISDLFAMLTDPDHKSGFKTVTSVLCKIFKMIEGGEINVPLYPDTSDPTMTNSKFASDLLCSILMRNFPHLQFAQTTAFTQALRENCRDLNRFKMVVRDFLIVLREYQSEGTVELFADEKEAELMQARERVQNIPGMLKPSEMEDD